MNLKRAAATLALTSTLAAVPASSAAAAPVSHDPGSGSFAREYWTPKRMRQAKLLSVERTAAPAALDASGLSELGSPGAGPAPGPARIDPATSRAAQPPATSPRIAVPPFASGQVPPEVLAAYPYSANGRLFGSFRGGINYSCSATVVASSSRNVALTAGHCLHDANAGFARRVVFVPAYYAGIRPFGTWTVGREVVSRSWYRTGNFHGDYGAVKLSSPSGTAGDIVGEEGIVWNLPREQLYQAIGYPSNLGDTELMWNCLSGSAGVDPMDRSRGAPDTGIGCDMSTGSSGGGWTVRDPAGNPYVNGVTSYGYKRLKNLLFAPYFNGKVISIVNQANAG